MEFLSLKNVRKEYHTGSVTVPAVEGVSFDLQEGEFVVILGASGAGKTTLLNLLGGMDTATSGEIDLDGKNVAAFNKRELTEYRRHDVGFVFQFYNLMPNLTAKENVELSTRGVKNAIDAEESLGLVGLGKRTDNFPYGLSGGEQQRVSIARAIAKRPSILLCDEPTGALDSKTGKNILILLKDLCEKDGQTVIIVTHNANIALIAERVIRLSDGKIVSDEKNPAPKEIDDIEW